MDLGANEDNNFAIEGLTRVPRRFTAVLNELRAATPQGVLHARARLSSSGTLPGNGGRCGRQSGHWN